jgi:hypothetical protein
LFFNLIMSRKIIRPASPPPPPTRLQTSTSAATANDLNSRCASTGWRYRDTSKSIVDLADTWSNSSEHDIKDS